VFHDHDGELTEIRSLLDWYPDQVWLWLLACQWQRISQEEAFVGRTAEVGDELGSRIVTARLARDLMRLSFLIERRYTPYIKWLGTAFATLDCADEVGTALDQALAAGDHPEREQGLATAYEAVARRHNDLGVTAPVDPATRTQRFSISRTVGTTRGIYHNRPYQVLHAERFVAACQERIHHPELRRLPLVGSIDQCVDSTDILSHSDRSHRLRALHHDAT
jgi:hypothetical protein